MSITEVEVKAKSAVKAEATVARLEARARWARKAADIAEQRTGPERESWKAALRVLARQGCPVQLLATCSQVNRATMNKLLGSFTPTPGPEDEDAVVDEADGEEEGFPVEPERELVATGSGDGFWG